jgi:hypothetical protein
MNCRYRAPRPFKDLVIHPMMGGCLGLLCAGLLVATDLAHVRELFEGEGNPLLSKALFALGLSLIFAVGASLSGYIFAAMEE